jgi:hypothetical protein
MHTPLIDNDGQDNDDNTPHNTTNASISSGSITTNKRQRSSTPEQPLGGLNAISPKRTMSEEDLYTRESSPIVSLPTAGDSVGIGENPTVPHVPTKMTEVFPPSSTMTNGEDVQHGKNSESTGSGRTTAGAISDLLPVDSGIQNGASMDMDQEGRGLPGSSLFSGNGKADSTDVPSLQDQFDLVKREYRSSPFLMDEGRSCLGDRRSFV